MKSDADEGMSPPPFGSRNTSIPGRRLAEPVDPVHIRDGEVAEPVVVQIADDDR